MHQSMHWCVGKSGVVGALRCGLAVASRAGCTVEVHSNFYIHAFFFFIQFITCCCFFCNVFHFLKEAKSLFGWCKSLVAPHEDMCNAIRELNEAHQDPRDCITDVASIFTTFAPILGPIHQSHTEDYDDIRLLFDKLMSKNGLFTTFCVEAAGRMEVLRGKKANPFNLTTEQLLPSASMSLKSKMVLFFSLSLFI